MDGHDKWSAKLGEAGEADVWHRNVTRAPLLPSWGGSARASKWKRQERKGKYAPLLSPVLSFSVFSSTPAQQGLLHPHQPVWRFHVHSFDRSRRTGIIIAAKKRTPNDASKPDNGAWLLG